MSKYKPPEVIPPEGGWEDHTWYIVDVKYASNNPVHRALFFTGFVDKKTNQPGAYSGVIPIEYVTDEKTELSGMKYVRFFKKLLNVNTLEMYPKEDMKQLLKEISE